MRKAAIVTLYGNANYGNKLQNYAVQEVLKKYNVVPITIKNHPELNNERKYILRYILFVIKKFVHSHIIKDNKYTDDEYNNNIQRTKNFLNFDKYINTTPKYFNYFFKNKYNKYDIYSVGSDQVWNPNYGGLTKFDLLEFVDDNKIKIAFSASIGVSEIPDKILSKAKKSWKKFNAISVREEKAKEIIESCVEGNVDVLIDPTMLLDEKEWKKIEKKPKEITKLNGKKFILNYFLGELNDERKKEIFKVAKKFDCEIINILDKNSPFYTCGPSEFIWLERNAFLICTDSFHSCVFGIIFNNPFIVFSREDNLKNMNSRIDTLLNKFELNERKYINKIDDSMLKCNFSKCNEILDNERVKSKKFLDNILLKNEEKNEN